MASIRAARIFQGFGMSAPQWYGSRLSPLERPFDVLNGITLQPCRNYARAHIFVSDHHIIYSDIGTFRCEETEQAPTVFTNVVRAPLYGTFLSWPGSRCKSLVSFVARRVVLKMRIQRTPNIQLRHPEPIMATRVLVHQYRLRTIVCLGFLLCPRGASSSPAHLVSAAK